MFDAGLRTTAMGILPHTDIDAALDLALGVDIPFWPQLPRLSFYEDMYAQASEGFPGIRLDLEGERVLFDTARFYDELLTYAEASQDPAFFSLSPAYSTVYHRFLDLDLGDRVAIRGQSIGPISFGLKIADEDRRPIIYNEDVKAILLEFMVGKINRQLAEMQAEHPEAFVWLDDPGLEFVFSSLSGYTDLMAREDLDEFLASLRGLKGLHLCGNPDWDFLLTANLELLSFDAYARGDLFVRYAGEIARFLARGGILSWGIVPTGAADLAGQSPASLVARLEALWDHLAGAGLDREQIVHQGLLAPATCCLVNPDRTETVDRAFDMLRAVSETLRARYGLN
ncbi:MAG: hypothetical protein PVF47_05235 [Anaerolineae bacterium]|jgi:hypothetical protein